MPSLFPVDQLAAAAAEVEQLAIRAGALAGEVRAKAPSVAGAFDHGFWRGPAAAAAADTAAAKSAAVSRCAAQLDELAADLTRHGRAAAERAELMRATLLATADTLLGANGDFQAQQSDLLSRPPDRPADDGWKGSGRPADGLFSAAPTGTGLG